MCVPAQLLRALRAEALRRSVSTAVASASALAARSLKVRSNTSSKELLLLLHTSEETTPPAKDSQNSQEADAQSESSRPWAENASTLCQAAVIQRGPSLKSLPDSIATACPEWQGQPYDDNDIDRSTATSSNLHGASQKQGFLAEAGADVPALNSSSQPLLNSQRSHASLQRQGQQPRQSQLLQPRLRERSELQSTKSIHSHSRSSLIAPASRGTGQLGVQASTATRKHASGTVSPNKDQLVKQIEVEKRGSGGLATTSPSSTSAAVSTRISMTSRSTNLTKQVWRGAAAQKSDACRGTSASSKATSFSPAVGRPGSYQNSALSPRGARDGSMTARPASPPRREGESPRAPSPRMASSRRPESPRLGRSMSSHTLSKSVRTESPRLQKCAFLSASTQELAKRKAAAAAGTRPESVRGTLASAPGTAPKRMLGASREDVAPAATKSAMTSHQQQVGPSVLRTPHLKPSLSLDLDGFRKPRSSSETEMCPTPLSMTSEQNEVATSTSFRYPHMLDRSQEGTQSSPRLQTLTSSPSACFVGAGYARHPVPIPGMSTITGINSSSPLRSRRPNSPGQGVNAVAMRGAAVPGVAMATRMSNVLQQPGWSNSELARHMAAAKQ